MNVLIINSSLPETPLSEKILELEKSLKKAKHKLKIFHLHEMSVRFCRGCFFCWLKTPGICVIPDDMPLLYQEIMNSNLVIFTSELKMGFINSEIKKVMDRMIPLLHPYFEIVNNEFHHRKRYTSYPQVALLIHKEKDTNPEDLQITHDWFNRFAFNFKTNVKFIRTTDEPLTSIGYEIMHNQRLTQK